MPFLVAGGGKVSGPKAGDYRPHHGKGDGKWEGVRESLDKHCGLGCPVGYRNGYSVAGDHPYNVGDEKGIRHETKNKMTTSTNWNNGQANAYRKSMYSMSKVTRPEMGKNVVMRDQIE